MSLVADLPTLYTPEPSVEAAAAVSIGTLQTGLLVFTSASRSDLSRDSERIEVRFTLGEATGHMHPYRGGYMRWDAWNAQLAVQLITKIADSDHARIRGVLRAWGSNLQSILNTSGDLVFWRVSEQAMDAGTTNLYRTESGYEASTLVFRLKIHIRPDAWPT